MNKDIEKAIEEFKELKYISRDLKVEHINLAIEALERQLNGGWISVSERLPNEEECNKFDDIKHPNYRKFLCTIKIAEYEPQTRELYFSKVFGWKYGAGDYNKHVIAWQPLPEPYKEVEKK